MNRGEYGDHRRYGAASEESTDDFDDEVVRRQRGTGREARWQAGTRQPADGWSTSPASRTAPREQRGEREEWRGQEGAYGEGRYGEYGEGRYRGPRTENPERPAASAPRGPGWRSGPGWHQGGAGYGDQREQQSRTLREEWGASRVPAHAGQGEHGYLPFAGSEPWAPLDFGRPEHPLGSGRRPVGPKGYQRSDARIRDEVCERLARSALDVSEVEVVVADGVVTLGGRMGERGQKYRAEEIADTVFGVRDVDNQIRVARACALTRETT